LSGAGSVFSFDLRAAQGQGACRVPKVFTWPMSATCRSLVIHPAGTTHSAWPMTLWPMPHFPTQGIDLGPSIGLKIWTT
jgi:cystathionine beta-lyase/cystathionine gamma-synthase